MANQLKYLMCILNDRYKLGLLLDVGLLYAGRSVDPPLESIVRIAFENITRVHSCISSLLNNKDILSFSWTFSS